MNSLLILNDPAYGTERSYNGLRLAGAVAKRDDSEVKVFLIGDAVTCAMADQKVPEGYYHLDRMILAVAHHGGDVGCGSCMDARGIDDDHLTKGAHRSTLDELAEWIIEPSSPIALRATMLSWGGRRALRRPPAGAYRSGTMMSTSTSVGSPAMSTLFHQTPGSPFCSNAASPKSVSMSGSSASRAGAKARSASVV